MDNTRMGARERIENLLDARSFVELAGYVSARNTLMPSDTMHHHFPAALLDSPRLHGMTSTTSSLSSTRSSLTST